MTSFICEDKLGYQLFTHKLKPADKIVNQAVLDRQPAIMMHEIPTEDGTPLMIRFVKLQVTDAEMAMHLLMEWLLPCIETQRVRLCRRLGEYRI